MKQWNIYLSGEIHTDWRQQIEDGSHDLPVSFTSPVTDHDLSDAAGDHLGATQDAFWRDHQSSRVNAIRTKTLIEDCDLAIIRFGDKYKQWNAAFDAGYCAALNKPYVTLHEDNLTHPLKEVDAMALARAGSVGDIIKIIEYVVK
jgi:YtoQ family protein